MNQPVKKTNDFAPAIILMIMAPLLTEVLPGATRFSSLFVLPIEICVWGGGALMIRYAVRRWKLGWLGMLFLAIALAMAEEFIIQQTSVAPMVIRLKGVTYARAFSINYVYLLWALIYESVFVVFLPIYLVELIFPGRRERLWINKPGFFVVIPLFLIGSLLAWFTWTRIARTKVFKVPVYNPPLIISLLALAVIAALVYLSLQQVKNKSAAPVRLVKPWPEVAMAVCGLLWSAILFGLVLLGFGIAPAFPPVVAVGVGLVLIWVALYLVPGWTNDRGWRPKNVFALIFGVILGSMLVSFIGFADTTGPDLYFKIITNAAAIILLILLGSIVNKRNHLSI
jgi:hypothetical protein